MEEYSESNTDIESSELSDFEDMLQLTQDTVVPATDVDEMRKLKCLWRGCGQMFTNVDAVAQHLNEAHVGNNPGQYSCQWLFCPRKGALQPSRFSLITHLRSHTGEKPYFCPLPDCIKTFTRSDAITKHLKSVHDVDVAKPDNGLEPWWYENRKRSVSQAGFDPEELPQEPGYLRKERIARDAYDAFQKQALASKEPLSSNGEPRVSRLFQIGSNNINPDMKEAIVSKALASTEKVLNTASAQDIDEDEIDSEETLAELAGELEQYYDKLQQFRELVSTELQQTTLEKQKLWVKKELLLDCLIQSEIRNSEKFT